MLAGTRQIYWNFLVWKFNNFRYRYSKNKNKTFVCCSIRKYAYAPSYLPSDIINAVESRSGSGRIQNFLCKGLGVSEIRIRLCWHQIPLDVRYLPTYNSLKNLCAICNFYKWRIGTMLHNYFAFFPSRSLQHRAPPPPSTGCELCSNTI
jgi:hypothetical protein